MGTMEDGVVLGRCTSTHVTMYTSGGRLRVECLQKASSVSQQPCHGGLSRSLQGDLSDEDRVTVAQQGWRAPCGH